MFRFTLNVDLDCLILAGPILKTSSQLHMEITFTTGFANCVNLSTFVANGALVCQSIFIFKDLWSVETMHWTWFALHTRESNVGEGSLPHIGLSALPSC